MNTNFVSWLVLLLYFGSIHANGSRRNDVSILAMGMSGAGVFSTINLLLDGKLQKNQTSFPTVTEYSWPVFLGGHVESTMKVVVSPGQAVGKSRYDDIKILATVKEYIQSPSGLNGQFPSIILIVARFDDTLAGRINSNFLRMLKNVELLKDVLGYSAEEPVRSKVIFHLTHVMSKTMQTARRPNSTIEYFKNIITANCNFPEPITVTIGENRGDDYDLPRIAQYIRLPNKQLYPKNIIDEISRVFIARNDYFLYSVMQEAFKNPNPTIKTFSTDEESIVKDNTLMDALRSQIVVGDDESDINQALETAFMNLDKDVKNSHPTILQLVQFVFKRENITTRSDLPRTRLKIVDLFQKLPFHTATLALVQEAFDLKQPVFNYPTLVGYGYDLLKDKPVENTPYIVKNLQPTPIGYSLPDIYICTKENEYSVERFKLLESQLEFQQTRLKELRVEDSVGTNAFTGSVGPGYNILRSESGLLLSNLTAIQETRNLKLDLILSSDLDETFIADVKNLTAFKNNNYASEREWINFFGKYGTHIVTEAYGGGYMVGKATGEAVRNNARNKNILTSIKDTLLSFANLPEGTNKHHIQISHSFFGGSPANTKIQQPHPIQHIAANDRQRLLAEWKTNLKSDPRIMDRKIKLLPISEVARSVNQTIGQQIRHALDRVLQGRMFSQRYPQPSLRYDQFQPLTATTTSRTPTSTSCPATPEIENPECEPIKVKDYTRNVIGQGYDILKDAVLPTSPFGKMILDRIGSINVPRGCSVNILSHRPDRSTHRCHYVLKRMSSYSEYVKHRIYSIYQPLININLDTSKYKGTIKPGYNILEDLDTNGPFSIYEERRILKVTANFQNFSLSAEFIRDANKLESYLQNVDNCTVQEQWLDFFEKYGTHVVKAGYGGSWSKSEIIGIPLNKIASTKRDCGDRDYDRLITEPAVTVLTVTLDTLKSVLYEFPNQVPHYIRTEYDIIIISLLESRLKRCNE